MACGNNMVSRTAVTTDAAPLGHPRADVQLPGPSRDDRAHMSTATVAAAASEADRVLRASASTSEQDLRRSLDRVESALQVARRAARADAASRRELLALERKAADLRRVVDCRTSELAAERREQEHAARRERRDNLAPSALGVPPTAQVPQNPNLDYETFVTNLHVWKWDRDGNPEETVPHLPREDWDPHTCPAPAHPLAAGQSIAEIARTEQGDVSFLNVDGVTVAQRFTLVSEKLDRNTKVGRWMQGRMRHVLAGTGLQAGHSSALQFGGNHFIEFESGQNPSFNMGGQGGFETAVGKALAAGAVQVEVEYVVDAPYGTVQPAGYWIEAFAVDAAGGRAQIEGASGYFRNCPASRSLPWNSVTCDPPREQEGRFT